MEQKTTWMRYLLFGVFSLLITIGFSCIKEHTQKGIFVYVNQTNFIIKTGYQPEEIILMPNSTIIKEQIQPSRKGEIKAMNYRNPLTVDDNLLVKIGDKCILTSNLSENSIINLDNYISEKLDNRVFKFTYTFTEADYNRAVACP